MGGIVPEMSEKLLRAQNEEDRNYLLKKEKSWSQAVRARLPVSDLFGARRAYGIVNC